MSKSESRFQKSREITVCSVISVGSTVKLLNKYDYIIWVWNIKNLWIKIYFIFSQRIGMIFLILSKLNMLNFIWIRNNISHPDFRNAVGNITYEGRVYSIPTWTVQVEQSDLDSPSWTVRRGQSELYQSLALKKPCKECINKCKEYNGLPSAFLDYDRITKKLLRATSSSFTSYYVDTEYNFKDSTWYSRKAFSHKVFTSRYSENGWSIPWYR